MTKAELIEQLAEEALEEAEGAEHYARLALTLKKDYPELAQDLSNSAMQELSHEAMLYKHALNIANSIPMEEGSVDYNHHFLQYIRKKIMDHDVSARVYLEQYKQA